MRAAERALLELRPDLRDRVPEPIQARLLG